MNDDERKAGMRYLFELGHTAGGHAASQNTYSMTDDALAAAATRAAPVQRAGDSRTARLVWAAGFVLGHYQAGRRSVGDLEPAELDLLASALDVAEEGGWARGRPGLQAEVEAYGGFVDAACLLRPFDEEN